METDEHGVSIMTKAGAGGLTSRGTPETQPETPESARQQMSMNSYRLTPSSPSDDDSDMIHSGDFPRHSFTSFVASEEEEEEEEESEHMDEEEANRSDDLMESMPYKHLISSLQHQDDDKENEEYKTHISTGSGSSTNESVTQSPLYTATRDDLVDGDLENITCTSTPKRESIGAKRALFDNLYSMARTPTPQKTTMSKQEQWNQWWEGAETPSPVPQTPKGGAFLEEQRCATPIRGVGGGDGDRVVGHSQEWHVPSPRLLGQDEEEDALSVGMECLDENDDRSVVGDLSQEYFFQNNEIEETNKGDDIEDIEMSISPPAPSSNVSVSMSTPSPVAKTILDLEGEIEMTVDTPRVDNTSHLNMIARLSPLSIAPKVSDNLLLEESFPDDSFMNDDFVLEQNENKLSLNLNNREDEEEGSNSSVLDLLQQLQEPKEEFSVQEHDTDIEKSCSQQVQAPDKGSSNACTSGFEISDEKDFNEALQGTRNIQENEKYGFENHSVVTENEIDSSALTSYIVEIDDEQCNDTADVIGTGAETLLHSLPDTIMKEEDCETSVETKMRIANQTHSKDELSKKKGGVIIDSVQVNKCKEEIKIVKKQNSDQTTREKMMNKCQPLKPRDTDLKEVKITKSKFVSNDSDPAKGKTIPIDQINAVKLNSEKEFFDQESVRTSDIVGGYLSNVKNITAEQKFPSSMEKLRELRGVQSTPNGSDPLQKEKQNDSTAEVSHSKLEDTSSFHNKCSLLSIQDLLSRDKSSSNFISKQIKSDYVDIIPATKSNDDDISDISSLGSSSIKSSKSTRLMTRNLYSKDRVHASTPSPLDNIIQDFQHIQRSRTSQGWRPQLHPKDRKIKELEDIKSEEGQGDSSFMAEDKLTTMQFVKNDPLMRSDSKKSIRRSGLTRNGSFCSLQSTPCTSRERTHLANKLAPSKTDTRSGKRRSVRRNRKQSIGGKPLDLSVDVDVLDQYQQLQAQLAAIERNSKIMDSVSKKVDRYQDSIQYEDLFEQFKMIEREEEDRIRVEGQHRKAASIGPNSSASSIASGGQSLSNKSFTLKTSNNWFVDFESIKDDGFSSLLRKKDNLVDEKVMESKKRLYISPITNQGDKLSKKKKKKILKKIFRLIKRKSKSKNDMKESQSSSEVALGISSVSSVNTQIRDQDEHHQKRTQKMRFSFRRKKKKSKSNESTTEEESLCNGEDQKVYDKIIRESLEMIPGINIEDLNASDISFSDSDVSDNTSCNSICGYQTLS